MTTPPPSRGGRPPGALTMRRRGWFPLREDVVQLVDGDLDNKKLVDKQSDNIWIMYSSPEGAHITGLPRCQRNLRQKQRATCLPEQWSCRSSINTIGRRRTWRRERPPSDLHTNLVSEPANLQSIRLPSHCSRCSFQAESSRRADQAK
jgi:hypothetical protein